MKESASFIVPSLYIQNKGEHSTNLALRLTQARDRFIVRLTGGCGNMSPQDAKGLTDLFAQAFEGFAGAMIFGGTRMLSYPDFKKIKFGITEIPPLIGEKNPDAVTLGVIPRTQELGLSPHGLLVADEKEKGFITIVHPQQDICLVVQISADNAQTWDAEVDECLEITKNLREFAGWNSLLISYNGGSVTEKEIVKTAQLGWPILLINGSGRKTEEYANNTEFLHKFPNVHVAENTAKSLKEKLFVLEALKRNNFSLVEKTGAKKFVG